METDPGGKAVLLRGKLLQIGTCNNLTKPIESITVFDVPHEMQKYSKDTIVLWLPGSFHSLAQKSLDMIMNMPNDHYATVQPTKNNVSPVWNMKFQSSRDFSIRKLKSDSMKNLDND